MHKHLRYGVLENLSQVRRIRLGQLWGVALLATPIAWLSPASTLRNISDARLRRSLARLPAHLSRHLEPVRH